MQIHMNRIPVEILHIIFIQLPLKHRLKCMLVCRLWYHMLDAHSLFYYTEIYKQDDFDRFMNMIKRLPHRALQVEHLRLEKCIHSKFDNRKLHTLFPNLRCIYLGLKLSERKSNKLSKKSNNSFCTGATYFKNAKSRIEVLQENIECELTRQLCASNLCDRLKVFRCDLGTKIESGIQVLPYIKNMPVLEELYMSSQYFGIDECEIIHNNLPSIKKLTLDFGKLKIIDTLPTAIIPARSIEKLIKMVDDPGDVVNQIKWYQYLCKKYMYATAIDFYDGKIAERSHSDLMVLFNGGYISFLILIALNQKYLKLQRTPPEIDIFKELDDYGCQVKEIDIKWDQTSPFFEHLAQSNQSKYVRQLQVEKEIDSLHLFQNMISLTNVHIDLGFFSFQNKINLSNYLNAFPATLKRFSIQGPNIEADPSITRISSIQYLEISSPNLSRELLNTISTCFPNLSKIKLEGLVSDDLYITLPNHHLKEISLVTEYGESRHGFSVVSKAQPLPQYFIEQESEHTCSLYQSAIRAKPAKLEDLAGRYIVNLRFSTVNILNICIRSTYLYAKC